MIEYLACGIAGAIFGFCIKGENKKEIKTKALNECTLEVGKPSDDYIEEYLHMKYEVSKAKELSKEDFQDISYVQYSHNTQKGFVVYNLAIGKLGSMRYLLDENYNVYSGNGFHEINLENNLASRGASEYKFVEHIRLIKSGKAECFRL